MTRVSRCFHCNGTGLDDASWDGRCPFCDGFGDVDDDEDYSEDEDE